MKSPPQLGELFGRPAIKSPGGVEPKMEPEPEEGEIEEVEREGAEDLDDNLEVPSDIDDLLELFALDPEEGAGSMSDTGAYELDELDDDGEGQMDPEQDMVPGDGQVQDVLLEQESGRQPRVPSGLGGDIFEDGLP